MLEPFTPNGASFVDSIGDVLLLASALAVAVVWAYYWRFFGWTRSAAGRALWTFLAALTLVLVQNSIARFAGADYFSRDIFRTIIYLALFGAAIFIFFSLRHYKRLDDESFKQYTRRLSTDAFRTRQGS